MESDAAPLRLRLLQAGRFTLRQRKLESDATPLRLRLLQAELFYFAGTMALHRFLISGQDLRIAAAAGPFLGEIVSDFICTFAMSCYDLRLF